MSVYSICFSPTGGTQRVANIVGKEFFVNRFIDLTKQIDFSNYVFNEEDICIISVPSFGGRVPFVATERISQLKGNGAKAIIVAVYGNRAYEDTLLELKNTANECGFKVVSAMAAVAQHSLLDQFASGRPDGQDEKEFRDFAKRIQTKLANKDYSTVEVPGNVPYKEYSGVPILPKTSRKCQKCGRCILKCPVGAIPSERPRKLDKDKCISCMRCVAFCPENAKTVSRWKLRVAGKKLAEVCMERKQNEFYI